MISKYLGVATMCLFDLTLYGQTNLVQNPSFEVYDTCPGGPDEIERAIPWFQPNLPGLSSTDYFHTCSTVADVPSNFVGFQGARTGNAYAGVGIVVYPTDSIGREYLEGVLSQPLDSGRKYCFSLYTSRAEININVSCEFGIFLSDDTLQYYSPSYATINVIPQLSQADYIYTSDSQNWNQSFWTFQASGNERFFTLGAFTNYPSLIYGCLGTPCVNAYYYVDDVSMVELPELNAGMNDTICPSDSALLIGSSSMLWLGMQFEWLPHTGLADPFSLTTMVSPSSSTTYTLNVTCATCDVPCLDDVKDSVRISVVPSITTVHIDSICFGDTAILNGNISELWNGMQFEWLPHAGLSDPYSLTPIASPGQTTTYTLSVTCPTCSQSCFAYVFDTTRVIVNPSCTADGELHIQTLLSQGNAWTVLNLPANTGARIYDARGRLIHESADYRNDWFILDARGTYIYELNFITGEKKSGKIVVQ